MKLQLNDGEAFVEGRSPQKARELLAAAEAAGLDTGSVQTTSNGYIVPKEIAGDAEVDDNNRAEVGDGLPHEGYVSGIDDAQEEAKVGSELLEQIQPVSDAGHVEGAILNQEKPTGAKTEGTAPGNPGASVEGDAKIPVQETGDADHLEANEEAGEKEAAAPEQPATPAEEENAGGDFDPSDHKVDEVQEYLESASEEERQRVLAAEKDGKGRVTILGEEGAK